MKVEIEITLGPFFFLDFGVNVYGIASSMLYLLNNKREEIAFIEKKYSIKLNFHIDKEADLSKAIRITVDGKTQYPAACNAIETLLVHQDIARQFLYL